MASLVDAARLLVPPVEKRQWPSLGGHVCARIEERLVHGPGDVLGQPVELTREFQGIIWRAYEVHPPKTATAGRRRFKRVGVSRRKGTAKTELLAFVALMELDPEAPVRCVGWHRLNDRRGKVAGADATTKMLLELGYAHGEVAPLGGPVRSPYIPLIATTEEQSEDLAYGVCKAILEHCEHGNAFDVGEERITHRAEPGVLKALAGAPSAREGALTTFQGFDETHLYTSPRLKGAHATMLRNIPKRFAADAWSMETTTMYDPGEDSVARHTHELALDIAQGRVGDPSLYFDHRQAALVHDLSRRRELIRAIEEASGDALHFADIPAIANQYLEPGSDRQAFRRYWLNQRVKGGTRMFDPAVYEPLAAPRRRPRRGAKVVIAFDGSYSRDSTAIVGCSVAEKPHVFVVKAWERPQSLRKDVEWRTPRREVEEELERAVELWDVVEIAPDPPGWHREIEDWEEEFGELVVRFETNQPSRMGPATDKFVQGMREADFTHDGTEVFLRHLGNCVKVERRGHTLATKDSPDSPNKIDVAIGAIIAYSRAVHHHLNPRAAGFAWGPA